MSDVIKFPARDRVEIHFGPIVGSTDPREIGLYRFFIDVVEADGSHIGMHDCVSYDEAIIAAHELAEQWDCEVYDRVVRDEGGRE